MKSKLKQNQKGFTIIEVLIVLAIAGLIMVIVFLAVPALQRNSRNTQRTNDASRVSSGINECMSNNNGKKDQCDDTSDEKAGRYFTLDDNQQLITEGEAGIESFAISWGQKCNPEGTEGVDGGGARAFVVLFAVEGSSGDQPRCIGS